MDFVDTELHRESISLCQKFKILFNKYAICHNFMNSSDNFQIEDIQKLGESVA